MRLPEGMCWFSEHGAPDRCEGRLQRCHLLPRQRIRREYPWGAFEQDGRWVKATRMLEGQIAILSRLLDDPDGGYRYVSLDDLLWLPDLWVPGCDLHHTRETRGLLRMPREALPAACVELAEALGMGWSLDRDYGPQTIATADLAGGEVTTL